jgi:integrase/recombinase XerD
MRKTAPPSGKPDSSVEVSKLARFVDEWLLVCKLEGHSPRTLETRRDTTKKLLWFLNDRDFDTCSVYELRAFFAYLRTGHEDSGGRFGNPRLTKPLQPVTIHTFHNHCRSFFKWLATEEYVQSSPMERIPPPIARPDQIQPFSEQQTDALLAAAKKSRHPRRDAAIVIFLLDTGIRASELCGLTMNDVDLDNRSCKILGKGGKKRTLYFGAGAGRALWQYLCEDKRTKDEAVFLSDRGTHAGEHLTRSGLRQLIERLGKVANIQVTRCSPHTFRHTFAIEYLRNGGHLFSLKEILGHTQLQMVNKYVALAEADVQSQHRLYSPGDRLVKRSRGK